MTCACAPPLLSMQGEPERALVRFTEMTVYNELPPMAGARSGREKYVHEAFRLAKVMMDANHNAYGHSQFVTGHSFFCALR